MSSRPENRSPRNAADRAFRSTIGGESTAFGFSIMITVTFGAVQWKHGSPTPDDLLLYAVGAVAGFTALEAAASRGARESLPEHSSNVKTLGTLMNFASVALAVGAAIGLSAAIASDLAWPLCPAVAAGVYLAAETVELLIAERIQLARGNRGAPDVSDP